MGGLGVFVLAAGLSQRMGIPTFSAAGFGGGGCFLAGTEWLVVAGGFEGTGFVSEIASVFTTDLGASALCVDGFATLVVVVVEDVT